MARFMWIPTFFPRGSTECFEIRFLLHRHGLSFHSGLYFTRDNTAILLLEASVEPPDKSTPPNAKHKDSCTKQPLRPFMGHEGVWNKSLLLSWRHATKATQSPPLFTCGETQYLMYERKVLATYVHIATNRIKAKVERIVGVNLEGGKTSYITSF
jgi:hypothetical protein